ncbi:hypothetical protein A2721_00075 [Candidatus Gottesmanbacteria bacterium RIFCSPHIGHO2_01_FULL_47_48]|uniref:TVP38/TMEM64 family membrane protein n=1 Tax=Candidatus Gottesmanbacteria bacterium RIFCSPHIGHO2_01_FULL_47_48 TaxID=1798381 RepID=A0A1F6A3E5_9BACT|nr:MAG: hypothetical protein A2721_00075 [Candidatus Gottesmanbacteria bacterium RIFCSPHIGHO2_01_FULL_47_48]
MTNSLTSPIPPKKARRVIFHSLLFALSLIAAIILLESRWIHQLIEFSQGAGFLLAALVAGFFFSSIFTSAVATITLFVLGQNHHPLIVSAVAAVGTAFADGLILKFIRDDVIVDLELLTSPFTRNLPHHLLQSSLLHLPLTILAAVVIASPLPDELGITILGLIKFKPKNFFLLTFFLNFLGILAITSLGNLV